MPALLQEAQKRKEKELVQEAGMLGELGAQEAVLHFCHQQQWQKRKKMNYQFSFVFPSPKPASLPPALLHQAKDSQEVRFTAELMKEITSVLPMITRQSLVLHWGKRTPELARAGECPDCSCPTLFLLKQLENKFFFQLAASSKNVSNTHQPEGLHEKSDPWATLQDKDGHWWNTRHQTQQLGLCTEVFPLVLSWSLLLLQPC